MTTSRGCGGGYVSSCVCIKDLVARMLGVLPQSTLAAIE